VPSFRRSAPFAQLPALHGDPPPQPPGDFISHRPAVERPGIYLLAHIYIHRYIHGMVLDAATLFNLLADPTRLRSLVLLHEQGELCVCELTHALQEIQPKISRHLAALREHALVLDRREGQWIHYRINPALPGWALKILATTADANTRADPFARDRRRLRAMPNRPGARRCA
jgi:ArsR family transcriptional regulator